jgi:hypothetical protein
MAVATFSETATDFAAANWSDATGFTAAAQLVIPSGSQSIQSGLNQSASSIEYLDVLEGFTGIIGGASGALICDADGTAEAAATVVSRIRYWAGAGAMYFTAGGGNTLAHYVQINTGGRFYGVSGIMKNMHLDRGTASFSENVAATSGVWTNMGGALQIAYAAASAIPTLNLVGGSTTLFRNATTINVYGGNNTIDCKALAITTINMYGGSLAVRNCGTITTFNAYGGLLDFSGLSRPLTITTATGASDSSLTVRRSRYITLTNPFVPIGKGTTWAA